MKNNILVLTVFFILVSAGNLFSQSMSGKIFDASNSDPLVGAIVKIQGTNTGAVSDLDGYYEITGIGAGSYTLEFSYIGYEPKTVTGVSVTAGQVTKLDVVLQLEGFITEEITVEATTSLANEETMLMEQKNSNKVQDGISEQQIKRAPDAAASEVLKRVMGVNIVDNKYVFVRGTSERYNNTTLNGVLIPSTEPEKKSFNFDLFPSNMIENIIVAKTHTSDLVGNFSGGLVQINTKDFPDAFTFNFNSTSSFSSNTTTKDFMTYNAGQSKILFFNSGEDNGGRSLPVIIPDDPVLTSRYSPEQIEAFGRSFTNNWQQLSRRAPVNGGFQVSLGNKYYLLDNPFGFFAAYTYRNSFSNKDFERNSYSNVDFSQEEGYSGQTSAYSVAWGGLLNLSYKVGDYNKFSIKNSYMLTSDDETGYFEGYSTPDTREKKSYSNKFVERKLLSTQVYGDHFLPFLNNSRLEWKASYSEADRHMPDYKVMTYQREYLSDNPFSAAINYGIPTVEGGSRFFSDLKDINRSIGTDFLTAFRVSSVESKIKLGILANGTKRDFSARQFAPSMSNMAPFTILFEPLDSIFRYDNIASDKIRITEITRKSDRYNAEENLYAGYSMLDLQFDKFKMVTGARLEYNEQILNTTQETGPLNLYKKKIDILPSINMTYILNDFTNIRAAYSQVVSRPELRELAPFGFYDFNEGVFVIGNPDLRRSIVRNYDLRFEYFPTAGEILSVSAFYKKFDAPLEQVFLPGAGAFVKTRSYLNADKGAVNYGLEFEVRKNLGFVSKLLKDLSFNGNLSFINSKVELDGLGSTASEQERKLQGQSPYTVNLGLFYDNYKAGMSVNLLYNRFGRRISEVGIEGYADVIENPRDAVDMTVTKNIFDNFELKLSIRDLLNQEQRFTQKFDNEDKTYKMFKGGTSYSLTVGYKL
jgi:hypothetical protein